MGKKQPTTPVANATGVKPETIKAAADIVVNDAENVSNTVSSENTEKEGTEEGIENDTENGATTTTEKVVNETFAFNGKNYTLAPFVKKLQVAGRVHTREEILNNKEIMSSLIIGNSPFIKKS